VIFIDTSVFYAILDHDDRAHAAARTTWISILSPAGAASLITSNYVLVESFALIQERLGIDAVREFNDAVLPVVVSHWVTEQDHAAAVNAVLTGVSRRTLRISPTSPGSTSTRPRMPSGTMAETRSRNSNRLGVHARWSSTSRQPTSLSSVRKWTE